MLAVSESGDESGAAGDGGSFAKFEGVCKWRDVGELCEDGRVVVFTDGACTDNQDVRLRRAGVGCFWGRGHERNIAQPLPGELQTNQRAELQAIVEVLRVEPRQVEIRTDSQYVIDGVSLHMDARRRRGWLEVDNGDLWAA